MELKLASPDSVSYKIAEIFVISNVFIMVIIPLTAMIFLNVCLVFVLHKSFKRQSNLRPEACKDAKNDELKISLLVLMIVGEFAILKFPSGILHFVHFVNKFRSMSDEFQNAAAISNSLVITEKSINCLIYCFFSQNFRQKFSQLVCRKKKTPKTENLELVPRYVNEAANDIDDIVYDINDDTVHDINDSVYDINDDTVIDINPIVNDDTVNDDTVNDINDDAVNDINDIALAPAIEVRNQSMLSKIC